MILTYWLAPYNDHAASVQQARFRGLRENVLNKMVKSTQNVVQTHQTMYQGEDRQLMTEFHNSLSSGHFGGASMRVRFIDPAETALSGDRDLTHVRLREADNYVKIFDMNLLSFALSDTMINLDREARAGLEFGSRDLFLLICSRLSLSYRRGCWLEIPLRSWSRLSRSFRNGARWPTMTLRPRFQLHHMRQSRKGSIPTYVKDFQRKRCQKMITW